MKWKLSSLDILLIFFSLNDASVSVFTHQDIHDPVMDAALAHVQQDGV